MTNYDEPTGSTGTVLRIESTYSQSQSNNTTTAKVTLKLIAKQATGWANDIGAYMQIGGHKKSVTFSFDFTSSKTKTIGSYSVTYSHDSAGNFNPDGYHVEGHINNTGTQSAGGPTTVSSGQIHPPRIPKPPSAVRSLAISSITGDGARLDWSPPSDNGGKSIDMYHVHVSTSSSFSSYDLVYEGMANHYYITGYSKNTKYYVRVIAHNSVGWNTSYVTPPSISFTTKTTPSTVGTPSVSNTAANTQKVSWSAPSNGGLSIDSYQVQVSTSSNMSGASTASTSSTSFTNSKLANGTTYYWRVRAHNSAGYGSWSGVRGLQTYDVPSAPSLTSASVASATFLAAAWSKPSSDLAVSNYELQWSTNSSFSSPASTTTSSTSKTQGGLNLGQIYYWRVRAYSSAGWGGWSNVRSATQWNVPGAPTSVVADGGPTSTTVSWKAPGSNGGTAVTDYDVQFSKSSSFSSSTTISGSATSVTVDTLDAGVQYFWRVRAKNAAGTGSWSATATSTQLSGGKVSDGATWGASIVRISNGTGWDVGVAWASDGSEWKPGI